MISRERRRGQSAPTRMASRVTRRPRRSWSAVVAGPLRLVGRLLLASVTLRREGANLCMKLVPCELDAQRGVTSLRDAAQAPRLRAELKTLLDAHPLCRQVMRYLALFESALASHGMNAPMKVSLEVLSAALEQFDVLVHDESASALGELRASMTVAVAERSRELFDGRGGERLSEFNTDSRVLVEEVTHSMFMEFERQYEGSIAAKTPPAGIDPIRLEFAPTFPPNEPFIEAEFEPTQPLEAKFAPTRPTAADSTSLLFMR